MIRLAVFDIDRTLVPPELGEIPADTVAALRQLRARGVRTAIASGRLFSFLQPELTELGFDYYILSNGAYVTDSAGNVLAQKAMDGELVRRLTEQMILLDQPIELRYCFGRRNGNPNCTVSQRMRDFWKAKNFKGKIPKAMQEEYVPREGEQVVSCSGCLPGDTLERMEALFPELAFLPVFDSPLCDINAALVSKASGLELVCGLAGVELSQTIAFGDDRNDLEMICSAGIGVAMGDGLDSVIAAADYVTAPSHEGGIAQALRHYSLI